MTTLGETHYNSHFCNSPARTAQDCLSNCQNFRRLKFASIGAIAPFVAHRTQLDSIFGKFSLSRARPGALWLSFRLVVLRFVGGVSCPLPNRARCRRCGQGERFEQVFEEIRRPSDCLNLAASVSPSGLTRSRTSFLRSASAARSGPPSSTSPATASLLTKRSWRSSTNYGPASGLEQFRSRPLSRCVRGMEAGTRGCQRKAPAATRHRIVPCMGNEARPVSVEFEYPRGVRYSPRGSLRKGRKHLGADDRSLAAPSARLAYLPHQKRRPDASGKLPGTDPQTSTSAGCMIGGVYRNRDVTAGRDQQPSLCSANSFSALGSARGTSAMLHPGVVDGPTTLALQAGTVVTAGETAPILRLSLPEAGSAGAVRWSKGDVREDSCSGAHPVMRGSHGFESHTTSISSSGDGLGIHQPGSMTRGFAVERQPASGRARDRVKCSAGARSDRRAA
ncbi:hypothetical protein ACVWZL_003256 [Bradyrhizobium sp. GM2.4]